MIAAGHVLDRDHIDQFQQLRVDLRDDGIRSDGDQGHARDGGVVRRGDRQRLDVVAASGNQAGDAGERAGFVLQENRNDVAHGPVRGYGSTALGRQGENC